VSADDAVRIANVLVDDAGVLQWQFQNDAGDRKRGGRARARAGCAAGTAGAAWCRSRWPGRSRGGGRPGRTPAMGDAGELRGCYVTMAGATQSARARLGAPEGLSPLDQ
jgi:hypothetical protein